MPTLHDDDDAAALFAILAKFNRIALERDLDKELQAELQRRSEARDPQFEKLIAAFAVFGFTLGEPDNWDKVKAALGADRYYAALNKGKLQITPPYATGGYTHGSSKSELTASLDGDAELDSNTYEISGTVRDIVIERLKAAGTKGAKAADIRAFIENARGTELHEKTIGMTLYRLSKDGVVRREGRTWFFVPQTKNPGAVTPGLINRDDKKGDEP